MSPGLLRAREPYRVRNALTGIALGAFAFGIWAYSISAVKQDIFDDVDAEVMEQRQQQHLQQQQRLEVLSLKEEKMVMEAAVNAAAASPKPSPPSKTTETPSLPGAPVRGLLLRLDSRYPWLLDPQQKTLVWGAPSVDNIGKITMRR